MAAKQLQYNQEARQSILAGVEQLSRAVMLNRPPRVNSFS